MSVPIEKLDRQHPIHALYCDTWAQLELLSAGGVRIKLAADTFLQKRPKEVYDVYQERIRRFTYQNILGTALGWYNAQLFRRNPTIEMPEGSDPWYADTFLEDCDRTGTSFVDFFRSVFRHLALYQASYVLVDKPHADEQPANRQQEIEQGLDAPYLIQYNPQQVRNWADDEEGNLKWIVIKTTEEVGDFLADEVQIKNRWYYFDRQNYRIYESVTEKKDSPLSSASLGVSNLPTDQNKMANLIDEGRHALAAQNIVPVHRLTIPEDLWLGSRVYLLIFEHINLSNSYWWALFMANLAMPVIFSDTEVKNVTLSEVSFLQLGQNDKFEWSEPPGKSYEHSAKRLDTLREEIYRSLYLQAQGRSSSASASSQSGYSKEMDMMPANDVLAGFGDKIRQSMQAIGNNVALARGDADVKFDVNGFKFESKPITESISTTQEMLDLGIFAASPTLEKEMMKTVAEQALDDRNDDLKQKVKDEIEASPTTTERDAAEAQAQQQAFTQSFQRTATRQQAKEELASAA